MKISLNDFLLSHKKTAGIEFVEKIFIANEQEEKPADGKTFCLTRTGAEVYTGKPVVAYVHAAETLKEKIARFERLERNLNLLRMKAWQSGAIAFEDEDVDTDDFEFANENSNDVDAFGDPFQDVEDPFLAEPEKGADESAQPSMPAAGVSPDDGVPADDVSSSGMPSQPNDKDAQK